MSIGGVPPSQGLHFNDANSEFMLTWSHLLQVMSSGMMLC